MMKDLPAEFGMRGTLLAADHPVQTTIWVADGYVSRDALDAPIVADDVWLLPGLVDAHCHIGLGHDGPVSHEEATRQAETDRDAGVLLVRDTGVPMDTRFLDQCCDLPRIIRCGQHIARPKRYFRGYAVEIEPEQLPDEVARQASRGDGWVKVVGDWIERSVGDLAPLWSPEIVAAAVARAHECGARIQVHTFSEEAVGDWVRAGADCIEHGTGLDDELISIMAEKQIALVPTLINLENFPRFAAQGEPKYPTYAAHMRALHARRMEVIGKAIEAGVPTFAGSDAGGLILHGRIGEEVAALARLGGADFAIGAASWRARDWLGVPSLTPGAPADLLVLDEDPRPDPASVSRPRLVVRAGRVAGPLVAWHGTS